MFALLCVIYLLLVLGLLLTAALAQTEEHNVFKRILGDREYTVFVWLWRALAVLAVVPPAWGLVLAFMSHGGDRMETLMMAGLLVLVLFLVVLATSKHRATVSVSIDE